MQAINLLTHLILDLLRWTALAWRPIPSHLVQPTGIEPVYLPFQGSTHPSKSKLHIINCHHGSRKSTPYQLEVKNP